MSGPFLIDPEYSPDDWDFFIIRICLIHYPNSVERTGFPSTYHATDWPYVFNGFEEDDEALPW